MGRDRRQDDLADDLVAELPGVHVGVVLRGYHDRPDGDRPAMVVLDGDLGLAVGPQVREVALLAHEREAVGHPVGQRDRQRHELRGLVAGEPEHHPLVAGAEVIPLVHALRDVRALLLDADHGAAGLVVEPVLRAGVADVPDRLADDVLELDIRVGGDLAEHEHEAGRGGGLTGDPGVRVLRKDVVQDRVGDLVAHLVGVALGHRL